MAYCRWNWAGVMPLERLKCLPKWLWDEKPRVLAISRQESWE